MATLLEMRGISKAFAGVKALNDVNFTVKEGEIHALVGENGAGKSTLMKVLSGLYPQGSYDGSIVYDGEERHFRDINDSEALGIIIIHQELALIPLLSIAENIFMANPPSQFGVIDRDAVYKRSQQLLAKVGLNEAPETLVTDIGVGKQQLVEIAKALSKEVRLLILDEPTASLNESDSAALLDLLREFRAHGMSAILISDKLNEVARVADRITVLRDGRTVDTLDCKAGAFEEDRIIRKMVDRDLEHRFPKREPEIGEVVFKVDNWSVYHPQHVDRQVIRNVDFHVRRGEIVGIAGLMGAGRTEFATSLSGGNQQKVVLSKWLFTDPEILILDEPTRGIDIGAKYEIYCIINELADAGKAVVVISSEMPELLGICDRICVMNAGVFVGEFERAEATQEKIMRVIMRKGEQLVDRGLERRLEEKLPGEGHP